MGKKPETPNPKPEREMGKKEKKPKTREGNGKKREETQNQRGKWDKEENGKRKREGEPNGATTPLPSSENRDVLCAGGSTASTGEGLRAIGPRNPLRPDL